MMIKFPEVLKKYWGKAKSKEDSPTHHLFVYHCLDVAAVAACWWESDPALRSAFIRTAGNLSSEKIRAWALFFIALHDLGKLDFRFQLKARQVAETLNHLLQNSKVTAGKELFDHGSAGLHWFKRESLTYGFSRDEEAKRWMESVAGHHGCVNQNFQKPYTDPNVTKLDAEARRDWVALLAELFLKPAGLSLAVAPPPMPTLLAGFCCVSDWIGSNDEIFNYVPTPDFFPSDYFEGRARDLAAQALEESRVVSRPATEGGMRRLFPNLDPRGVQTLIDDLPLGPGLFLIEAPTGQGKTEAAVALASRLMAAGFASSVVFALPTQATANAMLGRLAGSESISSIQSLFPHAAPNFVLAHGKARFNRQFQFLKRAATGPTAQGQEEAAAQCAKWLAQSRKRVFLGQFGVCTVDQVLLSVLPVKHHFVRSFGLGKSVLIIDEVHAYDTYMNILLDQVIAQQRRAGGSVILLSATLPEARRAAIFKQWDVTQLKPAGDEDYPLLTAVVGEQVITRKPEITEASKSVALSVHRVRGLTLDDEVIQRICAKVLEGALVAVMCNLVADAQTFAERLKSASDLVDRVDLFHARFRFQDRERIEQSVLQRYGKNAPRASGGGRVLVATQVIEQSLDLDFDWIVTQICPIELLIQRIGRLWRHKRDRRYGVSRAECLVLTPEGDDFGIHAVVYDTPKWLWRARNVVERNAEAEFPNVNRKWLREVYDNENWTHEPPGLEAAHEQYEINQMTKRSKANHLLSAQRDGVNPFNDTEERAALLTRDSQMILKIMPVLLDEPRRTLEGECFSMDDDFQLNELIDQHSVNAPHSWLKFLPKPEENIHFLKMKQVINKERWITVDGRFTYDTIFGLRMEASVS